MSDRNEICRKCQRPRHEHTPGASGPEECPPAKEGRRAVVVGSRIVGMDYEDHCAITEPIIEWQRPAYIPTFAAHLAPPTPAQTTHEKE